MQARKKIRPSFKRLESCLLTFHTNPRKLFNALRSESPKANFKSNLLAVVPVDVDGGGRVHQRCAPLVLDDPNRT